MNLYIFDQKIIDKEIVNDFKVEKYSQIRIGNKSVSELFVFADIQNSYIDKLDGQIDLDSEVLIISTSFLVLDSNFLLNYIDFISSSSFDVLVGEIDNAFIFKGKFANLCNLKDTHIYKIPIPSEVTNLSIYKDLRFIINSNPDSRNFNSLKLKNDIYTKVSTDKIKLKSEYIFLKNIPQNIQKFYADVYEYDEFNEEASYKMKAYPFKDISYQFLSSSLDKSDFKLIINLIKSYFNISSSTSEKLNNSLNDFHNLLTKNDNRFKHLKSENSLLFDKLDNYMKVFYDFSLTDHFNRIQDSLKENEKLYAETDTFFSHGDLCFSNILYSRKEEKIIFIDPKGYQNKGFRSPYYDLAKFSHSFLGKYDLIINDKCDFTFNKKLNASLVFDDKFDLEYKLFYDFVNYLKLDLKLVRLIESSLFLSMLPLHSEDELKCLRLCARSFEVFNSYKKL